MQVNEWTRDSEAPSAQRLIVQQNCGTREVEEESMNDTAQECVSTRHHVYGERGWRTLMVASYSTPPPPRTPTMTVPHTRANTGTHISMDKNALNNRQMDGA